MNDINDVRISGRLGRDMELRFMSDGSPQGVFSIAISRYVKRDPDSQEPVYATVWMDVQWYAKRAESVQDRMTRGRWLTVKGEIRSFQTDQMKEKGHPPKYYLHAEGGDAVVLPPEAPARAASSAALAAPSSRTSVPIPASAVAVAEASRHSQPAGPKPAAASNDAGDDDWPY